MPDVVLHDAKRNWLILVESVTSHGPVTGRDTQNSHVFSQRQVPAWSTLLHSQTAL